MFCKLSPQFTSILSSLVLPKCHSTRSLDQDRDSFQWSGSSRAGGWDLGKSLTLLQNSVSSFVKWKQCFPLKQHQSSQSNPAECPARLRQPRSGRQPRRSEKGSSQTPQPGAQKLHAIEHTLIDHRHLPVEAYFTGFALALAQLRE